MWIQILIIAIKTICEAILKPVINHDENEWIIKKIYYFLGYLLCSKYEIY